MNWLERQIDQFIRRIRDNPDHPKIPIGPNPEDPTYWRWFVIPRNRFVNLYLHNFRHDDEEDLHDHRMINVSFILQGSYYDEHYLIPPRRGFPLPRTERQFRPEHSLTFRLPSWPHRVVLPRDADSRPVACWSLFIGFPHWREWGFWCPGRGAARWIPWQEYVVGTDPEKLGYGQPGKGCGE